MTGPAGGGRPRGQPAAPRPRLDTEVVNRGLARSRTQAQALVRDGRVLVDGIPATKASGPVEPGQRLTLAAGGGAAAGESGWITEGWVGRGAVKLEHALTVWGPSGLTVRGRRCLDVGASTGGFTQVLLAHGAAHVVALDVGHGQLDPRVAGDPRVTDLPGTNIRSTVPETVGGPVDVVVGDLSFISVRHLIDALPPLLTPGADVVLLVKPQFEIGRERLAHDGVVRSPAQRHEVLTGIVEAARAGGLSALGVLRSPVTGASGNVEYLLWARPGLPGMMDWAPTPEELASVLQRLRAEEER